MTHKEYNGWTNYESWLVKLWIDNDQGTQEFWIEKAELHFKRYGEEEIHLLADELKEFHEEQLPELTGFISDLMNSAMSEVNWKEIAESLLEYAKYNAEKEEAL